jgi:hypothetical protein
MDVNPWWWLSPKTGPDPTPAPPIRLGSRTFAAAALLSVIGLVALFLTLDCLLAVAAGRAEHRRGSRRCL